MNNWAVELESQSITFEYIPRIRNTLVDTLSRLIDMDEDIKLQPEEEGKEFGYFPFKELPPVTTQAVEEVIECEIGNITIQHTDLVEINKDIHLPLKDDKLVKLQESDPHTKQLSTQWKNKNLDQNMYTMENNILKRKLVDNGLLYTPIVVPDILKDCLLILTHDKQGHNGFRRTYALSNVIEISANSSHSIELIEFIMPANEVALGNVVTGVCYSVLQYHSPSRAAPYL